MKKVKTMVITLIVVVLLCFSFSLAYVNTDQIADNNTIILATDEDVPVWW